MNRDNSPTMIRTCHVAPGQRAHHTRIYHRFCWSLSRSGYAVDLLAHPDKETTNGAITLTSLGESIESTLKWRLLSRLLRNIRAYRYALKLNSHLYIFYSPEFIPWALLLKLHTAKPIVFDCMEDFESYVRLRPGIPDWLRGTLALLVRLTLRFAAKHLDAITVADPATEAYFHRYADRIVTIYNFPRLELFPPRKLNQVAPRDFDLVYHGHIALYYLELILAIDEYLVASGRPVTWYLFGTTDEPCWFKSELSRRKSLDRFHMGGLISHDRVASEVRRARIGIIPLPNVPKFHSNIPQKLFEFMALGLPVILSDLPPSRPFVADKSVGILVEPNPKAYAQAIIRLLDDTALCDTMGREGRRRVESTYNWAHESQKLLTLAKTLVRRNNCS